MADRKMQISLYSAVLFLVISSPQLYKFTDKIFSTLGVDLADLNGCPTTQGLLLHTIVFGIVVYLSMRR
jgi:hypothetical protein